jgi:hypothetical protein
MAPDARLQVFDFQKLFWMPQDFAQLLATVLHARRDLTKSGTDRWADRARNWMSFETIAREKALADHGASRREEDAAC